MALPGTDNWKCYAQQHALAMGGRGSHATPATSLIALSPKRRARCSWSRVPAQFCKYYGRACSTYADDPARTVNDRECNGCQAVSLPGGART